MDQPKARSPSNSEIIVELERKIRALEIELKTAQEESKEQVRKNGEYRTRCEELLREIDQLRGKTQ